MALFPSQFPFAWMCLCCCFFFLGCCCCSRIMRCIHANIKQQLLVWQNSKHVVCLTVPPLTCAVYSVFGGGDFESDFHDKYAYMHFMHRRIESHGLEQTQILNIIGALCVNKPVWFGWKVLFYCDIIRIDVFANCVRLTRVLAAAATHGSTVFVCVRAHLIQILDWMTRNQPKVITMIFYLLVMLLMLVRE